MVGKRVFSSSWQLLPGEAPLEAATEPLQNQPFTGIEVNAKPNKPARSNTTYWNLVDKCGNKKRQVLTVTAYQPFYERMQQRLESQQGKRMKKRRQSTVEPVFGSLLNYFGMKRAPARGKIAAHKIMLAAATAYNLQKLAAFRGYPKATAQRLPLARTDSLALLSLIVVQQPR